MGKETKITILGDITCDTPLLEASRIQKGQYDFSSVFTEITPLLKKSDYTIANFETVCAGSKNDYQNEYFLCNCPDQILPAMKEAGIDFVTTANNHCLDHGISGMIRTLDVLDEYGIAHSGTYKNKESRDNNWIFTVDRFKIAILSYTSGTNASNTGVILDSKNDFHVGLLRPQVDGAISKGGIKGFIVRHLSVKQRRTINRFINRVKLKLGINYFKPFTDKRTESDNETNPYLISVKKDIERAKELADLVIVCPHIGGQFNTKPGTYSEFLVNYLKDCGADVIAANHPHVLQKAYSEIDSVIAYSIGSFNLSLSADYIVHESLPEYSMALHLYLDESGKISRTTFSLLKIVEKENHCITVFPINRLPEVTKKMKEDIITVYNRVTGKAVKSIDICEEYEL